LGDAEIFDVEMRRKIKNAGPLQKSNHAFDGNQRKKLSKKANNF
jgi:hypothetical protein